MAPRTPGPATHGTPAPADARWSSALELARKAPPGLAVADLADEAGYSPFHFTRLFTRRTGIGPGQYLIAHRVDTARRLLLADDDPVVDVATAVGFDSLSSFSRRFRETVGVTPGALRQLADRVADHPPRPFALLRPGPGTIRIHLDLPPGIGRRGDPSVWVGWYPRPAPIGLPRSGVLCRGVPTVDLPLCPDAPFLLAFAVPAEADVTDQLIPSRPVVAAHPEPLTTPTEVRLHFDAAGPTGVPMLSALPSLCRGAD